MTDQFNRTIDYLRISITDRCNLRCAYCMPHGVTLAGHGDILTYEELLQVAAAAVDLGIVHFKVTGGEPLVRRGAVEFMARLKALPGVETVTVTTNGVLLAEAVPGLAAAGVDGVNISLDAADRGEFARITGFDRLDAVLAGLEASLSAGLRTKLNCVLLADSGERVADLAALAQDRPVDVRFIEVMPIGAGADSGGLSPEAARAKLLERWPDLHPVDERRGFGPACYEASRGLTGRIGWISAVSHSFCNGCNRVRLTSTGLLKPCLCYGEGADLRAILRGDDPQQLEQVMAAAIFNKPRAHCFTGGEITERRPMAAIGG